VQRLDDLIDELEQSDDSSIIHDFAREDLFYLVTKDPALRAAIAFTIPSKDKFIDQAQSFLARMVKNCNMEESQVDAFMTCAKELILNAHRHGHQYDESKRIILSYRDKGDRVQLSIADQGPGFDHKKMLAAVQAKNAAQAARERYMAGGFGGLGFQLITRLSKDLAYNDVGNKVTFAVMKKA
jgi:anti-sigma regulatory factor (Ser/Thr protein kinase)